MFRGLFRCNISSVDNKAGLEICARLDASLEKNAIFDGLDKF